MKLLLLTSDYPPNRGGIARVMEGIANNLSEERLMVFAPMCSEVESHGNVIRLPLRRDVNCLKKLNQARNWYHHARYWIRHQKKPVKVLFGTLWPLASLGPWIKWFTGSSYSVIANASEIPTKHHNLFRKLWGKYVYERAEIIFCISHYAQQRVKTLASKANTVLVELGVDTDKFFPQTPREDLRNRYHLEGKSVLFTMGRMVKRKGFDTAIEAVAELKRRGEPVKLLLGGDGPDLKRLESLVTQLKLENEVIFLGALDHQSVLDHYALADAFLFLSRDEDGDVEGFGLVALEAAACGKPVVAGSSGGVPDAVLNGKTGFLVQPRNPQQVVKAVMQILQDQGLRERMCQHAMEHAKQRPWKNLVTQIMDAMEKVLR